MNLEKDVPLIENTIPCIPKMTVLKCPNCELENNIKNLRLQIEVKTGKKVIV